MTDLRTASLRTSLFFNLVKGMKKGDGWACRLYWLNDIVGTSTQKKVLERLWLRIILTYILLLLLLLLILYKAVPLQAWSDPEGSSKLRFPNFMTTAQDGGKVVSLTHRPPLPAFRGWVNPRAIVRSEGFYVNEKSTDTSWDRTSDLLICSTAP